MKQKYINLYLKWAEQASELSHAKRLKVGAVIVKDDSVISYGYNGTPAGLDNTCEFEEHSYDARVLVESPDWKYNSDSKKYYRLKTKPEVLHAERNALDKLTKRGGVGGDNAAMFCTHSPCLECAKSIYGAGIKEVYYKEQYRSSEGIDFLIKCGVNVLQVES